MGWDASKPSSNTRLSDSPNYFLNNWEAIEDWTKVQHYGLDDTVSGGYHKPGQTPVVWIGAWAALTGMYATPATGSIGFVTDPTSSAIAMVLCCASSSSGTWVNYGPSHLHCANLEVGHIHPQYICTSGDYVGAITFSGGLTLISTATLSSSTTCGVSVYASGSPATSGEAVTKYYATRTYSPAKREPYWPHVSYPRVDYDSGRRPVVCRIADTMVFHHGLGSTPDIICLYMYGKGSLGHEMYHTMRWTMFGYENGPMIVSADSVHIGIHGREASAIFSDANSQNVLIANPDIRVMCITSAANYNSGWNSLPSLGGNVASAAHGIGAFPDFYTLEISENEGTGHTGYAMLGNLSQTGNRTTSICKVDNTNYHLSSGVTYSALYCKMDDTAQSPTTGWYYRFRAWKMTPTWNSGWMLANGTSDLTCAHGLGQIPYLYLLEYSDQSDGSGDVVPLMSTGDYGYNNGVAVYWSNTQVKIFAPGTTLAYYSDRNGDSQQRTTGYLRLKAWCT